MVRVLDLPWVDLWFEGALFIKLFFGILLELC